MGISSLSAYIPTLLTLHTYITLFKYADEGMEYLKKNNQFVEENINEIFYDRLF